jgi:cytochrome c peroxidase
MIPFQYYKHLVLPFTVILIISIGCNSNDYDEIDRSTTLDQQLEKSLTEASEGKGLNYFRLPDDEDLESIPQDPNNPITAQKVALGRMLFHETGLAVEARQTAGMRTYSCASCHNPGAAMQPGRRQGIADGGVGFGLNGEARFKNPQYAEEEIDAQPIRAPSTLNVAFQSNVLWNGMFGSTGVNNGTEDLWTGDASVNLLGFQGAESQAIKGLEVHRMRITREFAEEMGYASLLKSAFPGVAEDTLYSRTYIGLAIAAFVRTINTSQAPFQQWLRGNRQALTLREKEGAILFFGKANCVSCHTGPALNKMEFAAVGMEDLIGSDIFLIDSDITPLGRGGFTGRNEDFFKFKIPQLYNLKDAPFLGHGSSFTSIAEVVNYFDKAVPQKTINASYLDERFRPIGLSESEREALTAFIADGLYDASIQRHIPESTLSNLCFPNADEQSKNDLGCD